jgi:transcriptional regulator
MPMTNEARKKLIRILLMEKGVTQTEIAKKLGCNRQWVNHIVVGRQRNERVEKAIAKIIGMKREELWDDDIKASKR